MTNTIKSYLGKYLKCPVGKKSVNDNTTYFIEHTFVAQTELSQQSKIISQYRNFFIHYETKPSLAIALSGEKLSIESGQTADIEEYRSAVKLYEKNLLPCLADVILRVDMASKDLRNSQEWSKQGDSALPGIGLMPIGSGGGMTVEQFYKSCRNAIPTNSSSATTIYLGSTESLLVFYMGPIYEKEHPRYAPNHLIVINNFEDVDGLKNRDEVGNHIHKAFPKNYDMPFFSTPIIEDYTKKGDDHKKMSKAILDMILDIRIDRKKT